MNKFIFFSALFMLINNFTHPVIQTKVFTNSGLIQSEEAVVIAEERFENNGEVIGNKSINIECGNLIGGGKIVGPKINIFAKEFLFRGTIDCSQECTITTTKPVNLKMFRRQNKGKFIFKVDPNLELPNKIKLLEAKKNFTGPLSQYWEECLKNFSKNVNNNTSICRICVQFDTEDKNENSDVWKKLKSKVRDIEWFMRVPTPSFSHFEKKKDLMDHINELPFNEIQNDKSINTKVNVKIVKTSDINNKIEDNCDYSKIILTYFILFDHNNSILKSTFKNTDLSACDALNLHLTALKMLKTDNIICNGYFYLYYEF